MAYCSRLGARIVDIVPAPMEEYLNVYPLHVPSKSIFVSVTEVVKK